MKLLAIDTSSMRLTVALCVDHTFFVDESFDLKSQAQEALPMIQRLLTNANVRMKDLDGIVFGRGPGSFTGLRISCSMAKGLAYAHDLPLFPVSSLLSIAETVYHANSSLQSRILTVLDARMQQVYWSICSRHNTALTEQVTNAEELVVSDEEPIWLAGVGFEPYFDHFPISVQQQIEKRCVVYPDASAMIRLVQAGRISSVSVEEALPNYIRDRVAHEKKESN